MRLAILNLTGGGLSGGHKKYLLNILPRLSAFPGIESLLCASPPLIADGGWLPALPKVSYITCGPFRPFRHAPDPALAAALDKFRPDVLFIPIERYINYKGLPVVVMLQNMAPLTGTRTGSGLKELLVSHARKYETRVALRDSAAVIVPTGYVKDFLAGSGEAAAGKVTAIPYGRNPAAAASRPPAAFPFAAGRFIFTAGSLEAYRGIEDLIRALPLVKEKHPGIKLAVAGGARPATMGYLGGLKKLAAELEVSSEIAWLGELPEPELSWCYANCSAFAVTSRIESFCFVALEALAHGCNAVSTDSPCLPEIFGEAALYYRAGDEAALSAVLSAILSRTAVERVRFSSAAASRAAGFSWDKAAASTLAVLEKAASAA